MKRREKENYKSTQIQCHLLLTMTQLLVFNSLGALSHYPARKFNELINFIHIANFKLLLMIIENNN